MTGYRADGPTTIQVSFTKEELDGMSAVSVDYKILQRLRAAGIPARGQAKFEGVNVGVLRALYDEKTARRTITWWASREFAAADGVTFDDDKGARRDA